MADQPKDSQAPRGMPRDDEKIKPSTVSANSDGGSAQQEPLPVGSVFLTEIHETKDELRRIAVIQLACMILLGVTAISALYLAVKIGNPIGLPR